MKLTHYIAAALLLSVTGTAKAQSADTPAVVNYTEQVTEVVLVDDFDHAKDTARPLRFAWGA